MFSKMAEEQNPGPSPEGSVVHDEVQEKAKDEPQEVKEAETGHSVWEKLGIRLVEARKALDLATLAEKEASEQLMAAQEKKNRATKDLHLKTQLVQRIAAEFVAVEKVNGAPKQSNATEVRLEYPKARDSTKRSEARTSTAASTEFIPITRRSSTQTQMFSPLSHEFSMAAPNKKETDNREENRKKARKSAESSSDNKVRSSGSRLVPDTNSAGVKRESSRAEDSDSFDGSKKKVKSSAEQDKKKDSSRSRRKPSYGKSIYRGVRCVLSDGHFEARISVNGSDILLGRFDNEEGAARCYDEAARRYRKGAAVLNFLTEADRASGCRSALEVKRT